MSHFHLSCWGVAYGVVVIGIWGCRQSIALPERPAAERAEASTVATGAALDKTLVKSQSRAVKHEVELQAEQQVTLHGGTDGPASAAGDAVKQTAAETVAETAGEQVSVAAPPPVPPAPLTLAEKIKRRRQLQNRIDERMRAARSQLTEQEQELSKQMAFHAQVFALVEQDNANDRANLAQRGLTMPWELSARRNLLTHGRRALESSVSESSLGLAAEIGNEQLRSIKEQIAALQREQNRLISNRVWKELDATEQAGCEEYLPEFAAEASGRSALEEAQQTAALAAAPQDAALYEARAKLRIARGELRKAAEDLAACIAAKPNNEGQVRLTYAELMLELGNQRTALAQFTTVAAMEGPIAAEGWARRGLMAFHDRDIKHAQDHVDRSLQIDPNCASAFYLKGRIEARLNRLDQTVEAFRAAVRCAPKNVAYRFELAEYLQVLKRYDEAAVEFAQTAELEPYWWHPRFALGRLAFFFGDVPAALANFNLAADCDPDQAIVFEARALAHAALGNTEQASADRQRNAELRSAR